MTMPPKLEIDWLSSYGLLFAATVVYFFHASAMELVGYACMWVGFDVLAWAVKFVLYRFKGRLPRIAVRQ